MEKDSIFSFSPNLLVIVPFRADFPHSSSLFPPRYCNLLALPIHMQVSFIDYSKVSIHRCEYQHLWLFEADSPVMKWRFIHRVPDLSTTNPGTGSSSRGVLQHGRWKSLSVHSVHHLKMQVKTLTCEAKPYQRHRYTPSFSEMNGVTVSENTDNIWDDVRMCAVNAERHMFWNIWCLPSSQRCPCILQHNNVKP